MKDKTKTKKAFREYLNQQDLTSRNPISWKNNRYHQRTRLYGDYLYSQDKIMFDVNYQEWLNEKEVS